MPVSIRIEPILPPKNYFDKKGDALKGAIVNALQSDVTTTLVGALRKRSENWSDSPEWSARVSGGGDITLDLKPTGAGAKKWIWVSGGTDRHDITPKRRDWLAFGSGYVPKTLPKGTYGQAGVYIGETVFTKYVDHPGIEARGFEQDVVDEEGAEVVSIINGAIAAALA